MTTICYSHRKSRGFHFITPVWSPFPPVSPVPAPPSPEKDLLGLRRAFSLAGAREIVVALWPVSDDSTPGFMQRFYQLALNSDRPAQALWQTQGEFLSAAAIDDDFELAVLRYAPFVLSQNSPLTVGPAISASPPSSPSKMPWLGVLAAIPLLLFLISRILVKKTGNVNSPPSNLTSKKRPNIRHS